MKLNRDFLKIQSTIIFFILITGHVCAQNPDSTTSPYKLPSGQFGNVPHYDAPAEEVSAPTYTQPINPPLPFDSPVNTNIYGEIKRIDGENETVFYKKTEPLPPIERKVTNGSKFLLMNEWLTSKRSFNKILVKILSNPPSNNFVGDTGWVELSYTSLYPYYDNDLNKIDSDFILKRYVNAAIKFRKQGETTTCKENRKCYVGYAEYYECMAKSEREHTQPACKMKNCTIEDCPGDTPKK
jgi:hypothetical protein